MATVKDLKRWFVDELLWGTDGNWDTYVYVIQDSGESLEDGYLYTLRFRFFTDDYAYYIVAHEKKDGSYLGCQASCRKWKAGRIGIVGAIFLMASLLERLGKE